MTLLEVELYRKIEWSELVGLPWCKPHKMDLAMGVLNLIEHFNHMTKWIAWEILSRKTLRNRIIVLAKMIDVMNELITLRNFNGAMEVFSALSSASVSRLKNTWTDLDMGHANLFNEISELLSAASSYKNYRSLLLKDRTIPCVPYLGVHLGDMVFIEEGNKDFVSNGMINFSKCYQVAKVVGEVLRYQDVSYSFMLVEEVEEAMLSKKDLDEETLYQMSLEIEPRDAQEPSKGLAKRMTRFAVDMGMT
eukprot:Lithocolla_globosa_v1_NODE_122_length_6074_cov_8.352550.p4 type:complete len:249 gc:universal NODE_122_length_6074_cov_8.352550:772-26(-)